MDQGYTIGQLKETQMMQDYDKLKIEFEKKNFKILNPLLFATIQDDGNLIIRERQVFKNV
jgi:hypothetical protein